MNNSPVLSDGPEFFETIAHNAESQELYSYAEVCGSLALADLAAQYESVDRQIKHRKNIYYPTAVPDYSGILDDFDALGTEVINTLTLARGTIRAGHIGSAGFILRYYWPDSMPKGGGHFVSDIYKLLGIGSEMSKDPEVLKDILHWSADSNVGLTVVENYYRGKKQTPNTGYVNITKTPQGNHSN